MNEGLFDELVESVREGGGVLREEVEPSRIFVVDSSDVKRIVEMCGEDDSGIQTLD